MRAVPFTIKFHDGRPNIDEELNKLDIFAYEDEFRSSLFDAFDDRGAIKISCLYRMAWITMRARHGEKRPFTEWMEADDPDVDLRRTVDPTGETSDQPDEASLVSPPTPA